MFLLTRLATNRSHQNTNVGQRRPSLIYMNVEYPKRLQNFTKPFLSQKSVLIVLRKTSTWSRSKKKLCDIHSDLVPDPGFRPRCHHPSCDRCSKET